MALEEVANAGDPELGQEPRGERAREELRWLEAGTLCVAYIPDFLLRDVIVYFAPDLEHAREVFLNLEPSSLDRWGAYFTKKGARFLDTAPERRDAEGPFKVDPEGFRLEILEGGSFFIPKPLFKRAGDDHGVPIVSIDKRRPFNPWKPPYIRAVNFIKKYAPVRPVSKTIEYCLYEIEECGEVSGSTSWENAELLLTEAAANDDSVREVLADVFQRRPEDFPLGSEVYLRVLGRSGPAGFELLCGLHSHPHRLKRRHVAVALGKLGQPEGLSTLMTLLDDHETEVCDAALLAIGRIGVSPDDPLHERITALLDSDEPAAQVWAAAALYRGGDRTQEKRLIHLVKESDSPLYHLGELGQVLKELDLVQAVPFLIKRLRSDRIELQDDAAEVLRALTGLDIEYYSDGAGDQKREAIKAWKNWWEEYKRNRKRPG